MANITLVKHRDLVPVTCDGILISTYLTTSLCTKCGTHLSHKNVVDAQNSIEDHQTFYGLAIVLIDESNH